ncbi:helix-turn-helix domain-containing protein [Paenibacillus taiwanensis]|uniref:helix-turn-helix domain-containing protein n=1 Tax=Paenibacillus taiwanensis TaxID=401638 RepID=UPI00040E8EDE|nr:helix-turn-helix domain-containing protein [Paenibacillus taiwanensis]
MKALIVDDEVIIRTGLAKVIPWQELGFELLPLCSSAEDAMPVIEQELPQLVLTDIRMNGLDGLTLAAFIRSKSPDTQTIVYTGYDNFSYAQQALREGVSDYLLKTSRPDDIIRAALLAKERILVRRQQLAEQAKKEASYRDQLLRMWLNGTLSSQEAELAAATLLKGKEQKQGISGEMINEYKEETLRGLLPSYEVAVLRADGWDSGQEQLLLFAVENMLKEDLCCAVLRAESRLIVVCYEVQRSWGLDWESICKRVEQHLKCRLFAGVGSASLYPTRVPISSQEAQRAADFRLVSANKRVIHIHETEQRDGYPVLISAEDEAGCVQCIKGGNPDLLRKWVTMHISQLLNEPRATPESVMAYIHSIVTGTRRWLEKYADSLSDTLQPIIWRADALVSAAGADRMQWERAIFIQLQEVLQYYRDLADQKAGSIVTRAMHYIREHADGSLTLQHVAREVHIHPHHLSERFKAETGMNYIEFVTQARMERAGTLLKESGAKVADIGRSVGYEDVKYFSQLFKKHTGCTPTEYRGGKI